MVKHICINCNKEFVRKKDLEYHLEQKKKPCKIKININLTKNNQNLQILTINNQKLPDNKSFDIFYKLINSDNSNYQINELHNIKSDFVINDNDNDNVNCTCSYCYKKFVNIYSLKRHVNERCKVKKLDNNKKEEIFNKLLENEDKFNKLLNCFEDLKKNYENIQKNNKNIHKDNEKLREQIKELENKYNNDIRKIVNKNINNTINNTNNNITNNLIIPSDKLVNFGKEDLSKISYEDIINTCSSHNITGYHVITELIKKIHFNDKLPEFQNVYMTDRNREKYMIWKNKWLLGDSNIFKEIMIQPQELIGNYEEEIEDDIENNRSTAKKINDILDKYYDCKGGFNDIVDPKVKDLIYNNREDVKNNFQKIQNKIESKQSKMIQE